MTREQKREELESIKEELELIEAYNERGKDSDKWLELDERREELEAELFHGVTVRGYLERSCRGLMESDEVNDEGEALDLAWNWLHKGLFVEVITYEDRTLYSPENFRDSTDWRDNVIEHEFRENGVV